MGDIYNVAFLPGEIVFGGIKVMSKAILIMAILFSLATIIGATYVIINGGRVNAGYAVVPMVASIALYALWRKRSGNKKSH